MNSRYFAIWRFPIYKPDLRDLSAPLKLGFKFYCKLIYRSSVIVTLFQSFLKYVLFGTYLLSVFEILQQMLQKVWRKSNDKGIQKVKKVLIFVSLLNNPVFSWWVRMFCKDMNSCLQNNNFSGNNVKGPKSFLKQ